jgi:Tachylectin
MLWIAVSLLTCPVQPVQTQGDPAKAKEVVDAYSTVAMKINPIAGALVKAFAELLNFSGYYGAAPDPFKLVNQRLDALEHQITRIESEVSLLRGDHLRERNYQRLLRLKDSRAQLKTLTDALEQKPTDRAMKTLLVGQVHAEVEKFLDPELWIWSDLALRDHVWPSRTGEMKRITAHTMLEPDFKPLPTLEYYGTALVIWMMAIEHAADGDVELVKRTYAAKLQQHVTFLSVRPGWDQSPGEPQTLPEHIKYRIQGAYVPDQYPEDRVCTIHEYVRDGIGRQFKSVGLMTYTTQSANPNQLCSVPEGLRNRATSGMEDLARNYGTELMALLAQKLTRLKDRGTVREQYTGVFDPTYMTPEFLYAIRPDGDLIWQRHSVVTRREAPQTVALARNRNPAGAVLGQPRGGVTVVGLPVEQYVAKDLEPPTTVAHGWGFKRVFPGSDGVIYAVNSEDKLVWHMHKGYTQGTSAEIVGAWQGPTDVGTSWGSFQHVFGAGDGVIYAVDQEGQLLWYKHDAHLIGSGLETPGAWHASSAIVVQKDWNNLKQVFSGGQGVIYAVTNDGRLLWYRHNRYLNAVRAPWTVLASRPAAVREGLRVQWERSWEGPKEVGSGWNFKHVFSSGGGALYAVTNEGKLLWYKHIAFEGGGQVWWQDTSGQQYKEIGAGWGDAQWAFAVLAGAPRPSDRGVR